MNRHNLDIKFWKAMTAYTLSIGLGSKLINKSFNRTDLIDLAVEYSPNYKKEELDVP
jgi:hypothetical protein